jgi:hypothetical protein
MPPIPPIDSSDTAPIMKPLPSLSHALTNVVQRATDRANDSQRMYGPIAALWDEYLESDEVRKLPERLRGPLRALCKDISATANRHFDAFIKGTHSPGRMDESTATNTSPRTASQPSDTPLNAAPPPPTTYAQAASTTIREQSSREQFLARRQSEKLRPTRPDTRLFVRLGQDHKAREAGAFAILLALKSCLGDNATPLKEVQTIKSGYALCTDSLEDLAALEKSTDLITRSIGNCTVERQAKWTTYRLDNVPRTVNTLSGSCAVGTDYLTRSILDITGQTPIRTVETSQSIQNGLYNTSWFTSFETESHTPLPKTLRILGVVVTASTITFKPKTIQCTRCFQWHNTRCCSRAQRCRICGSNNHSEENHTTRCISAKPHTCPARCMHCGGPHPADDRNCPLRLTHKGPKSKAQREDIIRKQKAARTRACANAKCSKPTILANVNIPADTPMEEEPTGLTIPTPTTPTRRTSPAMPASTPATRFRSVEPNRFTPLFKLTQ